MVVGLLMTEQVALDGRLTKATHASEAHSADHDLYAVVINRPLLFLNTNLAGPRKLHLMHRLTVQNVVAAIFDHDVKMITREGTYQLEDGRHLPAPRKNPHNWVSAYSQNAGHCYDPL